MGPVQENIKCPEFFLFRLHGDTDHVAVSHLAPYLTLTPQGAVLSKGQDPNQSRTGKDIARVTFDLYRQNPKDVFGSLNVKGTFSGRYSVSADFQCLGPKKVLR